MTDLDTELLPAVAELVADYGKSVTFTVSTRQHNPLTGEVIETEIDYIDTVSPPEAYDKKYIDGETVKDGDVKITVPAQGIEFTPDPGIKVMIDTVVWIVITVSPVYSGEYIAAYELQLRS